MRILHVTPTFFAEKSSIGGGERYVNYVCRAVAAVAPNEVHCDMLSFGAAHTTLPVALQTDLHILSGSPDSIASFASSEFYDLIDAYDVIHVHQCLHPFGLFVAARARLAGKVVVGTDHGGGEWRSLEAFPIVGDLFDAFHAQSNFARHAFSFFNRPVVVVRGPVDENAFTPDLQPRDRSLIVSVGRILPHKGYEHILDALPSSCSLVIVGRVCDNDYFDYLRTQSVNRRVTFECDLSDEALLKLIRSAGLNVHASQHVDFRHDFHYKPELLALAPLECMCVGVPSVTSRAGALSELEQLAGCHTFARPVELAGLLREHAEGALFDCDPTEIRRDVIANYGLRQFGVQYLELLRSL